MLSVQTSFPKAASGRKLTAPDQWFEELYPMIIHPRNPYVRVDTLPSDRNIRVDIDGVTVAECNSGVVSLWETDLRVRWYLPKTSVRRPRGSEKNWTLTSRSAEMAIRKPVSNAYGMSL